MENNKEQDELVDIRLVAVNKELSADERKADFVRQIRNPYRFKCGDFIVNAHFDRHGVSIEQRLQGIIR